MIVHSNKKAQGLEQLNRWRIYISELFWHYRFSIGGLRPSIPRSRTHMRSGCRSKRRLSSILLSFAFIMLGGASIRTASSTTGAQQARSDLDKPAGLVFKN